jgi:hypothetical protein
LQLIGMTPDNPDNTHANSSQARNSKPQRLCHPVGSFRSYQSDFGPFARSALP